MHESRIRKHGSAEASRRSRPICSADGCDKESYARKLCRAHYIQWYNNVTRHKDRGSCSVEGCGRPIITRSWCSKHYNRWRRYGNPQGVSTKPHLSHGMTGTAEYRAWQAMKRRCYNPNVQEYSRYGARGIEVCERWRNNFINFFSDMGPRPSKSHTIDRIDGDKGYGPDNCRWGTKSVQGINQKLPSTNKSGFRGVCLAASGRWRATIVKDGVFHHIGVYDSKYDAARSYNEAAVRLHGVYAKLNIIEDDKPA